MKPQELYDAWAPAESPWSNWAKPVLFASTLFGSASQLPVLPPAGITSRRDTAFVIDLVGDQSVLVGLALAERGVRPVPLYNCSAAASMVVDVTGIARTLRAGATLLGRLRIPDDAPPAFLLNADRLSGSMEARTPGRYDNRWCVVPQDMPSASHLQGAGIRRVILVSAQLQDDLAHILFRYQEAGLQILHAADPSSSPGPLRVTRPRRYKSLWYRLAVFAGLRRNSAGGFGGVVPDPQAAGG